MHTNWCVLIKISMEIGMIHFWIVIVVSCVTLRETHVKNGQDSSRSFLNGGNFEAQWFFMPACSWSLHPESNIWLQSGHEKEPCSCVCFKCWEKAYLPSNVLPQIKQDLAFSLGREVLSQTSSFELETRRSSNLALLVSVVVKDRSPPWGSLPYFLSAKK